MYVAKKRGKRGGKNRESKKRWFRSIGRDVEELEQSTGVGPVMGQLSAAVKLTAADLAALLWVAWDSLWEPR